MISQRTLQSFRIGQRALGLVLPRDRLAQQSGEAAAQLPTSIFNWTYQGMRRTEVLSNGVGAEVLKHWIEQCADLDIQPTLLLYPEDKVCQDDELDDLLQETSVEIIWVHPAEVKAEPGEWTRELAVALPDESVVDAYYSQAGEFPISAWALQPDLDFWMAYGAAIQQWEGTGSYHWHECAEMTSHTASRPSLVHVPATSTWLSKPGSDLSAIAAGASLGQVDQVASHCSVPFVFNIRRGSEWMEYGRLPKLSLSFELSPTQVSATDRLTQYLKSLPDSFRSRLATLGALNLSQHRVGSVSGKAEVLRVPLTVLKSNELAIEEEQDLGELIMASGRWTVRIPFWSDEEIDPSQLSLEFQGFLDSQGSGAAITKQAQLSREELYHFDFHLEADDFAKNPDMDKSGVFRLYSDTLDVLLAARPADPQ